ncbi:MAG: hypothetical protein RBS99_07950 [Rhodospirillales bacterium]|jgi:hypothetical protein|nr:hypothetical protein [Rhodospirillales bacterium]
MLRIVMKGKHPGQRGARARRPVLFSLAVLAAGTLVAGGAVAQTQGKPQDESSLATSLDCTEITVDYVDDPTLTDAERIARMDEAFFRSLSRYEACRNAANAQGDGGGGGGGGAGGGGSSGGADGASGEEDASGAGGGKSVASSDMSGTEKPAASASGASAQPEATDSAALSGDGQSAPATPGTPVGGSSGGGKLPEDIPPSDNDTVLERQIREAAMRETDPAVKEKLWNEYRRYKGIKQKQ